MEPNVKQQTLRAAQEHVDHVRATAKGEMATSAASVARFQYSNDVVDQKLRAHFAGRLDELHHLFPNPYFVRCDVTSSEDENKAIYFGKHALVEEMIFSWTSPAARLRFFDIGSVEYAAHDGKFWKGTLQRKDQFMISDGKIVFMTSESSTYGRTLVYQEQLSQRKAGFILPEIVARMERAQDDVIRANYRGSYLISGPAGSGKTTLAFHRIAYLLQSPDTAAIFSQENIVTFVQDEGTRAYFSQLLPELGIHNVSVTTFAAWAFERLKITDFTYIQRANGVDSAVDLYEYRKIIALRPPRNEEKKGSTDPFDILAAIYRDGFTPKETARFIDQRKDKVLDRYDLTILLLREQKKNGLTKDEEYFEQKKNFEIRRLHKTIPLQYSLVVVDEVQNYLPEQVALLRSCVSAETASLLYVGDLAQQIFLGTLRNWSEAGEHLADDRKVVLDKVYRSTKQIMKYVQDLGFPVSVPEELREGSEVIEKICTHLDDELEWVQASIAEQDADAQIGILSFSEEALLRFDAVFTGKKNIHVLPIHQAQGVEFDAVYLVRVRADNFASISESTPASLAADRKKIQSDMLYVALTRAMDRLCIVGDSALKDCINSWNKNV